ncbi:hypothetical protein GVAV_003517 [Gurleya vavrai]
MLVNFNLIICVIAISAKSFFENANYGKYKTPVQFKKNQASNLKRNFEAPNKELYTRPVKKNSRSRGFRGEKINSPIASITIPEIQPVLDIISAGSKAIYDQIEVLLGKALGKVQGVIEEAFKVQVPEIKKIINDGNAYLQNTIADAFDTASNLIIADFNDITPKENDEATENINRMNQKMLKEIIFILDDIEKEVSKTVEEGLNDSTAEVIKALADANQSVYTQVEAILADPTNKKPILPQIKFADADEITKTLTNENAGIYQKITDLIQGSLDKIAEVIKQNTEFGINDQSKTLNLANEAIFISVDKNVKDAMVKVQNAIIDTTNDETTKITKVLDTVKPSLIKDIENILSGFEGEVTEIVTSVTKQQIIHTVALITKNNNQVLLDVLTILETP